MYSNTGVWTKTKTQLAQMQSGDIRGTSGKSANDKSTCRVRLHYITKTGCNNELAEKILSEESDMYIIIIIIIK